MKIKTGVNVKKFNSFADLDTMIGIKDDVLHMFLLFHVLILVSFTILIVLFVFFLLSKGPSHRRDLGGWFGGPTRSLDQTSSYFASSQPVRRRGFFSRN